MGLAGHIIDVLAVVATIFGLATSLWCPAGCLRPDYLFQVGSGTNVQMAIIVGVTAWRSSVLRGLDGGVKVLNDINMATAGIVLFFVIFAGPTMTILDIWVTSSTYVANLVPLSNPFGREDGRGFELDRILGLWISWSPFMVCLSRGFQKGRTVRVVTAVLIIPT